MKHILARTDAEARGFRKGEIGLVVEPIEPQPEDVGLSDVIVGPLCEGEKWPLAYHERDGAGKWDSYTLDAPYTPGEIVRAYPMPRPAPSPAPETSPS